MKFRTKNLPRVIRWAMMGFRTEDKETINPREVAKFTLFVPVKALVLVPLALVGFVFWFGIVGSAVKGACMGFCH